MSLLWIDLANSLHHDWRGDGHATDRLSDTEWQASFLQRHQLLAPVPAPKDELDELRRFRDLLRAYAWELYEGGAVTDAMVDEMNERMSRSAVIRRAEHTGDQLLISWLPEKRTWTAVIAEAAANFAQTMAEGQGSRMRLCDNENCKWVFLDDTRNRSKRYCEDKTCGNLMKVRRFRERKKSEAAEQEDK